MSTSCRVVTPHGVELAHSDFVDWLAWVNAPARSSRCISLSPDCLKEHASGVETTYVPQRSVAPANPYRDGSPSKVMLPGSGVDMMSLNCW